MRCFCKKSGLFPSFILFSCLFLLENGIGFSEDNTHSLPSGIVGKDGAPMVLVPAGEFLMGTSSFHKVYLDAYYIDKYEVTNEQFAKFLNEYGKDTDEKGRQLLLPRKSDPKKGLEKIGGRWIPPVGCEKCPVLNVTWHGAAQYARFYGKRLPTEAEWEKACRAGTTTRFHFGNRKSKLNKYAWFRDNSRGGIHPVGMKNPNSWGIHDMYGNSEEWCYDRYDANYFTMNPLVNPKGPPPDSGLDRHVLKGGSWNTPSSLLGSGARRGGAPDGENNAGFRCAVDAMIDL